MLKFLIASFVTCSLAQASTLTQTCSQFMIGRSLYQPKLAAQGVEVPNPMPEDLVPFRVSGAFGVDVSGRAKIDSHSDAPVFVMVYGNAMNMDAMIGSDLVKFLRESARDFALFDLPGYGSSRGEMSERAMVEATKRVIDHVRLVKPKAKIVLWGISLGSAIGIQAAAGNDQVDRLIFMSGFSTLARLMRTVALPLWAPDFYLEKMSSGNSYDSLKAAGQVSAPTLVIHGRRDNLVPKGHSAEVFSALAAPQKELLMLEGNHFIFREIENYREAFNRFVDQD